MCRWIITWMILEGLTPGAGCVVDKLSQGTAWRIAGFECRSVDSPNLNLYWYDIR